MRLIPYIPIISYDAENRRYHWDIDGLSDLSTRLIGIHYRSIGNLEDGGASFSRLGHRQAIS